MSANVRDHLGAGRTGQICMLLALLHVLTCLLNCIPSTETCILLLSMCVMCCGNIIMLTLGICSFECIRLDTAL